MNKKDLYCVDDFLLFCRSKKVFRDAIIKKMKEDGHGEA